MSAEGSQSPKPGPGAHHLAKLSALRKRIQEDDIRFSLLIVEDDLVDARFIETPLGKLFGTRAKIDVAPDLAQMTARIGKNKYDVVLLDDRMNGQASAESAMRSIRTRLAKAPVIVVSRFFSRQRSTELSKLGAHAVCAKDDLDSITLGQMILDALDDVRRIKTRPLSKS